MDGSVKKLKALSLPKLVNPILDRLEVVAAFIAKEDDNLQVTIDPVESRGLKYYSGLGFSFFHRVYGVNLAGWAVYFERW